MDLIKNKHRRLYALASTIETLITIDACSYKRTAREAWTSAFFGVHLTSLLIIAFDKWSVEEKFFFTVSKLELVHKIELKVRRRV